MEIGIFTQETRQSDSNIKKLYGLVTHPHTVLKSHSPLSYELGCHLQLAMNAIHRYNQSINSVGRMLGIAVLVPVAQWRNHWSSTPGIVVSNPTWDIYLEIFSTYSLYFTEV